MVRRDRDDGAAAVEFALLLPVFLILVFGMISAGFAFARWINMTQTAREGSRYGATLPIAPSDGTNESQWLQNVYAAAVAAGGDDVASTTPGAYVCVSFVAVNVDPSIATTEKLVFTGGQQQAIAAGSCWDDTASGLTDNRVQVEVGRNTDWDIPLAFTKTVYVHSRSVTRYERKTTT